MKNISYTICIKSILLALFCAIMVLPSQAQILDKVKDRVKRTAENRTAREAGEKTDDVLDEVFEKDSKKNKKKNKKKKKDKNSENSSSTESSKTENNSNIPLSVYRKFNFVAGDQVMLYEDFSKDRVGDFPSRWNTNVSGEIVTLGSSPTKWLQFSNKAIYVPDVAENLPNEYTIEFDLETKGLSQETNSQAFLHIILDENSLLRYSNKYARISIPMCQYIDQDVWARNNGMDNHIHNEVGADLRNAVLNNPHISIAVNNQHVRLWVDEIKIVDIPRFIDTGNIKNLKFEIKGLMENEEFIFITNLKIAKGGIDYRNDLMSKGSFSTTGILFDSGSSNIKGSSYGTLKMIADILKDDSSIKLEIIGHTDSDGEDAANLTLSQKRAAAVKTALSNEFGISGSRMSSSGQGETKPVDTNNTLEGKANNRRVEFKKN